MKILYVLHADFEKPGVIADWATELGFSQKTVRPFAGEPLPSVDSFDMLVVMGGPQSPSELDQFPYLEGEIDLTKRAIAAGKVVLGFCLGAQIIGETFDARTERSPFKEVGVFPIMATEEGREDSLFKLLPKQIDVAHWHNDMPGVPNGSIILATSEGCPRQVIRYGKRVYGFQCHFEVKKENIEEMVENCSEDLAPARFVQSKEELLSQDYSTMNGHMRQFLTHLYQQFFPQK